jgi:dGTPase
VPSNEHNLTREHADPLADALPPLALDRQRIVHSAAFRRLLQKTQVFVALEDDHFRTRMTHTLEVAHLARCLADALHLNADLAEVVALAHDLGHPPFGHAGEVALHECLREHGGFEHNQHTLRIVEELEHPYPQFHGLNLTWVVRSCLAKHRTRYDRPGSHPLQDGQPPPPEGLVTALADRASYALHDLQDGLYAGVLAPAQLDGIRLWRAAYRGPALGADGGWRSNLRPTIDVILSRIIADVVAQAQRAGDPPVRLSDELADELSQLDQFLIDHLYRSHRLARADAKAKRLVTAIFEAYVAEPRLMPPRYSARIAAQGLQRVVADYLAGMTDRFCLQEHARLFDARADA